MRIISICVLCYVLVFTVAKRFAYVSVLSSNSFLLTAKVLANRLQHFNDTIPYIVILTEDITPESESSLMEQGVKTLRFEKIDTPYIETHKARKYQYTKIRLWNMTEYDVITHLDLDIIPMSEISSLFECGSFCASFRHSDMFNSGVFVLKPNVTVYNEMVEEVKNLYSYDGGDQGFLNTFFNKLKFAPMFDEDNIPNQPYESMERRLSAAFNYDIGMYYLNGGRMLVTPKIIHYTMGPTKPWIWWTYPMFDLNYLWLEARWDMEARYGSDNSNLHLFILMPMCIFVIYGLKMITEKLIGERLVRENIPINEETVVLLTIIQSSIYFWVMVTPTTAYPLVSWAFFITNLAFSTTILASIYSTIRLGKRTTACKIMLTVLLLVSSLSSSYMLLANVSQFGQRVIMLIFVIIYNQIFFVLTLSKLVLNGDSCTFRYKLLTTKSF